MVATIYYFFFTERGLNMLNRMARPTVATEGVSASREMLFHFFFPSSDTARLDRVIERI